jgi:iron-sulfur cluster repair protein YtfE (RIC family)
MRVHAQRVTLVSGVAVLLGLFGTPRQCAAQEHLDHTGKATQRRLIDIPSTLRAEHEEIHNQLIAATRLSGKTGEAARALAEVLHPHFVREEQIALPPLGLLQSLASGQFTAEMTNVLPMTDSLRAELPRMLEEHKTIGAATRRLRDAAAQEGDRKTSALAEQLLMHAQSEEQVTYPAAIMVGEVVRKRAHEAGAKE